MEHFAHPRIDYHSEYYTRKKQKQMCLYITITSTKNCMYSAFQNLINSESIVHIVSQCRAEFHSPFICLESPVLAQTRSATQAANKQNRDVFHCIHWSINDTNINWQILNSPWLTHANTHRHTLNIFSFSNSEVPSFSLSHTCKHTHTNACVRCTLHIKIILILHISAYCWTFWSLTCGKQLTGSLTANTSFSSDLNTIIGTPRWLLFIQNDSI